MKQTPTEKPEVEAEAGLKRALASALAHAKIQRDKGRKGKSIAKLAGSKKKKPKAKPPKFKRGSAGLTKAEQKEVDQLVPREAQQHGAYEPVDFKFQEVTEGGKRKEKTVQVIMNRGGTAVERWHRTGRIDDRQMAAVMVYQGAYTTWLGHPRVVANWNALIVRQAYAALELHAATRIQARQTLRLFDQEIFFRRGLDDFNVWQNVVIHDESAGVAGSRLGFTPQAAVAAAQIIISSIAHEIASLVIDQQPPDLAQLLLDIDTPRKPRRIK